MSKPTHLLSLSMQLCNWQEIKFFVGWPLYVYCNFKVCGCVCVCVCVHNVYLVLREVGIGCKIPPGTTKKLDNNRAAIIKLLITCFSEALYHPPTGTCIGFLSIRNLRQKSKTSHILYVFVLSFQRLLVLIVGCHILHLLRTGMFSLFSPPSSMCCVLMTLWDMVSRKSHYTLLYTLLLNTRPR